MATELEAAQKAAAAAQEAAAAAQRVAEAQEVSFLDGIKNIRQITENRTARDAARLKTRYISLFGLQRWSELVRDSR